MNIEEIIIKENLGKKNLSALKKIIEAEQPYNRQLLDILEKYINPVVDKKNIEMINTTTDALFEALDYTIDEWANDDNLNKGYGYVKEAIAEYITTPYRNIDVILDNIGFSHDEEKESVNHSMVGFIVSGGNPVKIQNAFKLYSKDYQNSIKHSTSPQGFIPIYAKAVVTKIAEMNKDNDISYGPRV